MDRLSRRQREVLALIASGYTNQGIAATLHIALGTVKKHVACLRQKLGAKNRAQALVLADEIGELR